MEGWVVDWNEVSDDALTRELQQLVRMERHATAKLVAYLAEFDRRRLYLAEGYASTFVYCTQVLHLSEYAAYVRIRAARAVRRCPAVLAALERGEVHLSTIRLLAPFRDHERGPELLASARHLSKREVEEIVARLSPRPDVQPMILKLPEAAMEKYVAGATPPVSSPPGAPAGTHVPVVALPAAVRRAVGSLTVLAPQRYHVQFTASAEMRAKIDRLRNLLRHEIPDGNLAALFDRALTVLLQQVEKRKFAATAHPRSEGPRPSANPASRDIPAAVRRAVWLRDGEQCAFTTGDGRRCGERGLLEFHHIVPFAHGGAATVENLSLRCRAHNQFEAWFDFGPPVT
jgi:hypothetical protein